MARHIDSIRRTVRARPAAVVVGVFVVSRLLAWAVGVRFDSSPLTASWQVADSDLLRHNLLSTVWYMHSQPPLFNLWLGLNLKLFGGQFVTAVAVEYFACGLVLALLLYGLLVRVSRSPRMSALIACVFAVGPAAVQYENYLFYDYPVATMLLGALYALVRFTDTRRLLWGSVFFGLVAAVVLTRTTFQLPWVVLALLVALLPLRGHGRVVLVACAVPLALVVGLYVKNIAEFGVPSTSSWAGMNLAEVAFADLSDRDRTKLINDGTLSPIAAVPAFSSLDQYPDIVRATRHTGIPVLDQRTAHGGNNFSNLAYVEISRRYLDDALSLIEARPMTYLRGVGVGLGRVAWPADDGPQLGDGNRRKLNYWFGMYDQFVLWRPPDVTRTAWMIVVLYGLALVVACLILVGRRTRASAAERGGWPLLAFAACTLLYAAVVITFGEVAENQRLRFSLDPIAIILVTAGARQLIDRRRRPA